MKIFIIDEYHFSYFDKIHINSMIFWIIFGLIVILLPYIFKSLEKGFYTVFLGWFLIFMKIFDIVFRIFIEKHLWYDTVPLNLCNMAIIFGGIYLITKKRVYFNLLYFWFIGALLAILLPNIVTYRNIIYPYIFMGTHILEIVAVLYGFIHLDEMITLKGFIISLIGYLVLVFLASIWNYLYNTNFMFVNDYIISAVDFIKPFSLYVVLLIILFELSIVLMYLPFARNQKKDIEEKVI